MAVTRHSITYDSGLFHNGVATGTDIELLTPTNNFSVSSILITNTHASADVTVSLYMQNSPTDAASESFYIIDKVKIPSGVSLSLGRDFLPTINNSIFGLYLTVGSTDTLDLIIS